MCFAWTLRISAAGKCPTLWYNMLLFIFINMQCIVLFIHSHAISYRHFHCKLVSKINGRLTSHFTLPHPYLTSPPHPLIPHPHSQPTPTSTPSHLTSAHPYLTTPHLTPVPAHPYLTTTSPHPTWPHPTPPPAPLHPYLTSPHPAFITTPGRVDESMVYLDVLCHIFLTFWSLFIILVSGCWYHRRNIFENTSDFGFVAISVGG